MPENEVIIMGLNIRQGSSIKFKAIATLIAGFALVMQPMYGLITDQIVNASATDALVINEINPFTDQVEFYNNGPGSVDLADYTANQFAPGSGNPGGDVDLSGSSSILTPGAFVVLELPSLNDSTGDRVVLKKSGNPVDDITFGTVTGATSDTAFPGAGESIQRSPDASTNLVSAAPTLGASNAVATAPTGSAPVFGATTPASDGTITISDSQTISATVTDADNDIKSVTWKTRGAYEVTSDQVELNTGVVFARTGNTWSGTYPAATSIPGNYTFTFIAADNAGNITEKPIALTLLNALPAPVCTYDFTAQKMWEVTWGYGFEDRNGGTPKFTPQSNGGLETINGSPTTRNDYHLYVTDKGAGLNQSYRNTYGFRDGTVRTVDVSWSDVDGCQIPTIVWTETPPDTKAPVISNITITPKIGNNIGNTVTVEFDMDDATAPDASRTRVIFGNKGTVDANHKNEKVVNPTSIGGNRYKAVFNTKDFVKANHTGIYGLGFNPYDTLGNQTSSKPVGFRDIFVDNSGPGSTLISPASGSEINGTKRFVFTTSDNTGVQSGYMKLNGATSKQYNLTQDGTSDKWYADVDTSQLVDGSYTIDARLVDSFGTPRYGSNKGNVKVDNAEPGLATNPTPANNKFLNFAALQNSGFAWTAPTDIGPISYEYQVSESNDPSEVSADGSFIYTVPNYNGAGRFGNSSPTPANALDDGDYYWHVRYTDAAGNVGAWNDAWKFTIDNTAPSGVTTYNGGNKVGDKIYVKSINELNFTEMVTDNQGAVRATYLVQKLNTGTNKYEGFCGNWNANSLGSHALSGSTNESYTESNVGRCNADQSKWTDGTYKIFHAAYDAAGNEGKYNIDRQIFVIDSQRPLITITDQESDNAKPTITGSVTGARSPIIISVDGKEYEVIPDTEGNFSLTINESLENGDYEITVTAKDEADNERVDSSATLTVAVVAPADTTDPADSGSNGGNSTPQQAANQNGTTIVAAPTQFAAVAGGPVVLSAGNAQPADDGEVLGDTDADDEDAKNSDSMLGQANDGDSEVLGDSSDSFDWNFFGIMWYWWLLILAALAAAGWWIAAARRRKREEQSA